MLDRRTFLASSTALGLVAIAGLSPAAAQPAAAAPANDRDQALDALLTARFNEDLRENPGGATGLGLDVGELAALRGQLGDNSQAKIESDRARNVRRQRELTAFGRNGLSPAGELNYDIAEFRGATSVVAANFSYGGTGGRPAPYVVSQLGGTYYNIPDFLDTQHPLRTTQDADYLCLAPRSGRAQSGQRDGAGPPRRGESGHAARFRARQGDRQFTAAAHADAGRDHLRAPRSSAAPRPRTSPAIGSRGRPRSSPARSAPRSTGRSPRFRRFARMPSTTPVAGGCRKARPITISASESNTTTAMSGEEIHRMGLEQVADLHRQLDPLLRTAGYTRGSVGERMNALNREPAQLYPNTDEGRAELLRDLNGYVALIAPLLPRVFNTIPSARLQINRVPPAIEAGAPGGYYQGAPLDNSRPGTYYINLRDTAEWPKYGLKTLTWHEGNPGHHFQGSLAREQGSLPLYRRAGGGFSAYSEGWALYSERVADELGVYEGDPLGRIGYLQAYLFRAVRLVVDSGMHSHRWSREQAVRYMVENAAEPETSAVREIERYSVWPGQACAYKIGQTVIQGLRDEAQRRMGARFDIKAFHDAMLLGGGPAADRA